MIESSSVDEFRRIISGSQTVDMLIDWKIMQCNMYRWSKTTQELAPICDTFFAE